VCPAECHDLLVVEAHATEQLTDLGRACHGRYKTQGG
jgi:hypothetical protein